jgi:hypothetical protein
LTSYGFFPDLTDSSGPPFPDLVDRLEDLSFGLLVRVEDDFHRLGGVVQADAVLWSIL